MKRSDRPQLFQHISMRVFSPHTVIHFSVSDGKVGGRQLCLGRFISLQICWYPHETEVKDFFVCSFGIAAHKKHACCCCAVLRGLYLWKTSVLLQGWCDLLLLLEWTGWMRTRVTGKKRDLRTEPAKCCSVWLSTLPLAAKEHKILFKAQFY